MLTALLSERAVGLGRAIEARLGAPAGVEVGGLHVCGGFVRVYQFEMLTDIPRVNLTIGSGLHPDKGAKALRRIHLRLSIHLEHVLKRGEAGPGGCVGLSGRR